MSILTKLIILVKAAKAILRGKAIIIEDQGGLRCKTYICDSISKSRAGILFWLNLKTI
jgi:hypothetical protein